MANYSRPHQVVNRRLLVALGSLFGGKVFSLAQATAVYKAGRKPYPMVARHYWSNCNTAAALGAAVQLGWLTRVSRGLYQFQTAEVKHEG